MSGEEEKGRPGPWTLFPEIIGISALALLLPLALIHLLLSGHPAMGSAGFALWLAGVIFAVRFIRRRQYGMALLPMVVIVGLFLVVYKLCQ